MNDTVKPVDETDDSLQQETLHKRPIKSFVIRAGRMTTGQQRGWDECWQDWGLALEQGSEGFLKAFADEAPRVLEIGYGMGHSLVTMATNESNRNFIGIEVHRPGVGSLLNEARLAGINNLRTYCDDAVEVLKQCVPDGSLSRVQIYFPDPWHKKRHNKRRLI
nr:tRNA (guanosine(46)-N7)-methyltransferase TrmB [Endozoicomonas sp.]